MVMMPPVSFTAPLAVRFPVIFSVPPETVVVPLMVERPKRLSVPCPCLMKSEVVVRVERVERVVCSFSMEKVVALPVTTSGAEMATSETFCPVVMAAVVVPSMVRLPPEMPTGAVVSMVSEEMIRSPSRFVAVELMESMAEKKVYYSGKLTSSTQAALA